MKNFHSHTTFSDGQNTAEEMIEEAIKQGVKTLAITDHHKWPDGFSNEAMDFYNDENHSHLMLLKKRYAGKINLLVGVELDWFKDFKDKLVEQANRRHYDHKIISVHKLKIEDKYEPIDYTLEYFDSIVERAGGIEKLVRMYYSEMRKAVRLGLFNAVGHLDLIKIYNKDCRLFSDKEDWYRQEVMKTLEVISIQRDLAVEINTSGFRKTCGEQYPADWIIEEAKKMKIPLILSTDAHHKDHIAFRLKEMEEKIK